MLNVVATGGTLAAACALVGTLGGELAGAGVVIGLTAPQERDRWPGNQPLHSLLRC
ncbi:MAG TPA: hypothetical protein VMV99_13405 [Rhodanobacter sp.]|nr:hypothetical protein [Rhodanobacter sp.]